MSTNLTTAIPTLFVALSAPFLSGSGAVFEMMPVHPTGERIIAEDVLSPLDDAAKDFSTILQKKLDALACYKTYAGKYYFSPDVTKATLIRNGAICERPYAEGFDILRIVADFK